MDPFFLPLVNYLVRELHSARRLDVTGPDMTGCTVLPKRTEKELKDAFFISVTF